MGSIHWIGIDGTENVEEAKESPGLKKMQEFVGGYIEHVTVRYEGRMQHMYVNEEGKLMGLRMNPRASELHPHDPIVGPAILLVDIPQD